MNALYPQNWFAYLDIFQVFLRLLGLFLLVPGFSHKAIPNTVKILLALSLSLAIFPIVRPYVAHLDSSLGGLVVAVLRETVIGFLMGFVAYITFEAINLGAQFVGYQMGFGSASLIDPQNSANVSLWVPLHGWLILMVFLFADMHHNVLRIFVMSFEATRQFQHDFISSPALLKLLVGLTGKIFILAVQMAAPFTVLVIAVNAALGVLARFMPQMNVLLFSFPLTMVLGFCTLYLIAPDMLDYLANCLGNMTDDVITLLRTL